MAVKTLDIAVNGITFPNFGKDNSKKNFRLLIDFSYFDKDGKIVQGVAATLPAKKPWQWESDDEENFVPPVAGTDLEKDATVTLDFLNTVTPRSQRRAFLKEGTRLFEVDITVIDVHDHNFGFWFKESLKFTLDDLLKQLDPLIEMLPNGLLVSVAEKGQKKLSETILEKLLKKDDKVLFTGGLEDDDIPNQDGDFVISGKGTLKSSGDKKRDYSVTLNQKTINS